MANLALLSAMIVICVDVSAPYGALAEAQPTAAAPQAATEVDAPAPAAAPAVAPGAEPINESAASLVFADVSDDDVAERVLSYLENVTTFTADFTQIAPSGAISAGKFYLRRPGLLRFQYDAPSPILIVATGGTVFVRDDALETTDSYPVGRTPLKFLLRKKVDFGDFDVGAVDRGVDSVAVTFASREEETDGEISIILSAPQMTLAEWIVRDPQNGVTIVTLDNVVEGEPIENRLFAAPKTSSSFLKN